jgi:hypothetical protein
MTRSCSFWLLLAVGVSAAVLLQPPVAVAGAAAPHPGAGEVRQRLQEVFERPEFGGGKEPSPPWLERVIVGFLRWLGSLRATAPLLFWLLVFLCVLALLGIITSVAIKLRGLAVLGRLRKDQEAGRQKRVQLSAAYREEALTSAARGELTEAVRFLFLSLVFRFDESGRVLLPRGDTNREYLRLFADQPRVAEELRFFVDTLDDCWYGRKPADDRQYHRCLELYERLIRQGQG